jgi:hypothetical protein
VGTVIQFRDWLPGTAEILGTIHLRRGAGVCPTAFILVYQQCRDVFLSPVRSLKPLLTTVVTYPETVTRGAQEDVTTRGRYRNDQGPRFPMNSCPVPILFLAKEALICFHGIEMSARIKRHRKDWPVKIRNQFPGGGGRRAEEKPTCRPCPPILTSGIPQEDEGWMVGRF